MSIHWNAGRYNNINKVKEYVENGGDVNVTNKSEASPLHRACEWGRYEIAQYLIKRGAKINIKSKVGYTPLHYAAIKCQDKVVELLLANGADVTIRDNKGKTARDYANKWGRNDVLQLIDNAMEMKRQSEKNK